MTDLSTIRDCRHCGRTYCTEVNPGCELEDCEAVTGACATCGGVGFLEAPRSDQLAECPECSGAG